MIVAITVTYNSSKYLEKNIVALINQTKQINKIIIVDNNSEEVHKLKIIEIIKNYENVEIIWLPKNTGGAGGFYYGMKWAMLRYNPEWFWIMDDDAYPAVQCLEELYKVIKYEPTVGCVIPLIYGIDNKKYQLYHYKIINKLSLRVGYIKDNIEKIKDKTQLDGGPFVGPLICKEVVKEIGFPTKELFIYGDDVEYLYRISQKFQVLLIKQALMYHKDPPQLKKNSYLGWWKEYYMYRNQYLFIKKFQNNLILLKLDVLILEASMLISLLKFIIINVREINLKKMRLKTAIYIKAIKDAKINKVGKTIDPVYYRQFCEVFKKKSKK